MLVGSAVLVVVAHRRRSRLTPMLWYLPVMLLLFSFVQYQNTLWGFQMAWYLVTLGLVGALYLLDRPHLTHVAFLAAIIAGVVASYSSLQGLTVWPVGLVLLYLRRRSPDRLITWSACGLAATALYFYDWKPSEFSHPGYVFSHPVESLKYFLFLLGSVLGTRKHESPGSRGGIGRRSRGRLDRAHRLLLAPGRPDRATICRRTDPLRAPLRGERHRRTCVVRPLCPFSVRGVWPLRPGGLLPRPRATSGRRTPLQARGGGRRRSGRASGTRARLGNGSDNGPDRDRGGHRSGDRLRHGSWLCLGQEVVTRAGASRRHRCELPGGLPRPSRLRGATRVTIPLELHGRARPERLRDGRRRLRRAPGPLPRPDRGAHEHHRTRRWITSSMASRSWSRWPLIRAVSAPCSSWERQRTSRDLRRNRQGDL